MIGFVKVRSWHIEVNHERGLTLCGLMPRAHPGPGEHQAQGWSAQLPPGEKSCESCLRIRVADEARTPDHG